MSLTPTTAPDALRELADGQQELILHAMRFPRLEALVYSTCSVYEVENEAVVRHVLERTGDDVRDRELDSHDLIRVVDGAKRRVEVKAARMTRNRMGAVRASLRAKGHRTACLPLDFGAAAGMLAIT